MGDAIGQVLPTAVGVAISVVPIISVILMLFTDRARSNSIAFLTGWIFGLAVVGGVVLALADPVGVADEGGESTASGVVKLVIGAGFLALAWRNWSSRPKEGEEPEMPAWMEALDTFTAPKSFGLAAVLSGVNPKNLGLTAAAAASIAGAGLSTGQEIGALAVFIVIASVTVAVPVIAYLVAGARAEPALQSMKDWLTANNNAVMAAVLLILAAKLIGDGIRILS